MNNSVNGWIDLDLLLDLYDQFAQKQKMLQFRIVNQSVQGECTAHQHLSYGIHHLLSHKMMSSQQVEIES